MICANAIKWLWYLLVCLELWPPRFTLIAYFDLLWYLLGSYGHLIAIIAYCIDLLCSGLSAQ